MIKVDIIQLIFLFSVFFTLFLCISKTVLKGFNRPIYRNYSADKVLNRYTRINNLTVDNYNIYNKFLIWLFVSES
ncbi:hypothetical protein NSA23_13855 [Anaerosalibacter massiliensis]|uniref:Uncharacterized protein n=1 Tax=Anaerosalibacter massiliensis TaxID=1347392 RepID=A0A9X2MLD7_9FIRM|nr:hypothetical protein [Anaerosalibacter massiliensis]